MEGDGHKVTKEWHFSDGTGDPLKVFTIYDWKAPGVGDNEEWVFNVGGRADATAFIQWATESIAEALKPKAKPAPKPKAAPVAKKPAAKKPAAKAATKAPKPKSAGKKK